MYSLHNFILWLSIAVGFLSAALWFYSAHVNVPLNLKSGYGALIGVEEMAKGFRSKIFGTAWRPLRLLWLFYYKLLQR
jgi:hypothetical protein